VEEVMASMEEELEEEEVAFGSVLVGAGLHALRSPTDRATVPIVMIFFMEDGG
jgi:hypothetical protein